MPADDLRHSRPQSKAVIGPPAAAPAKRKPENHRCAGRSSQLSPQGLAANPGSGTAEAPETGFRREGANRSANTGVLHCALTIKRASFMPP